MILAISHGRALLRRAHGPANEMDLADRALADAIHRMPLRHVVIQSVDRDDWRRRRVVFDETVSLAPSGSPLRTR